MSDFDEKYALILRGWIDSKGVDWQIDNTASLLGYWTAWAGGQPTTESRCSEEFRDDFLNGYILGLDARKDFDSEDD